MGLISYISEFLNTNIQVTTILKFGIGETRNIDFDEEAEQYRKSGVYATSLGDAMLLGLSNALRLQIIVFTSIPSWPYTPICP